MTDEYKQIIKEAGHDHIKGGEQGLQTLNMKKIGIMNKKIATGARKHRI